MLKPSKLAQVIERLLGAMPLLLLISVVGFTYWRAEQAVQEVEQQFHSKQKSGTDFALQNFTQRSYASNGQLERVLQGQELVHQSDSDISQIQEPRIAIAQSNAKWQWTLVSASHATVSPDRKLEMTGNVLLTQQAGELANQLPEQSALTKLDADSRAQSWVRADQLRYQDNVLEMNGRVKSVLIPTP